MSSPLALVFAIVFVAAVFGELEYYQDMANPPDEYILEELKEIFKSGEFLPYNPKAARNREEKTSSEERGEVGSPLVSLKQKLEEGSYGVYNDYDEVAEEPDKDKGDENQSAAYTIVDDPEFYFNMKLPKEVADSERPFAVPPVDPRYFQHVPLKADLKRAVPGKPFSEDEKYKNIFKEKSLPSAEFENSFEEPRKQRQNPNLAATKINKIVYPQENSPQDSIMPRFQNIGKLNIERDIPTSLVPTSPRHQHVIQQALRNSPGYNTDTNLYIYAIIAGIGAAATVTITVFATGWYTMRKKSKAAVDVEYPAYGVTGPNMDVTPSGDRQLAHSAQMYHYQHQKQQIIAMESRCGVAERNGSVSDAESEDENDEGDYTVYECPGFATTGEMEVKNPLFSDEPTPATPAQQPLATTKPKEK